MDARSFRPCGIGLLWFLAVSAPAPAQTTEGAVSGLVVELHSNEPVKRALVTLMALPRSRGYATAVTDGEGRFLFTEIPPGKYRLAARKDGYRGTQLGVSRPNQPGRVISLAPGEHRPSLTFRLIKLAAISGVVLDEDGDPVPNVRVSLLFPGYGRGGKRLSRRFGTNTNDQGEYRMFFAPPGRYYVMAEAQGRDAWTEGAEVSAREETVPEQFAPQFFPYSDRPAEGGMVELLPGGELRGVDFRLRSVHPSTLTLRLQLPSGLSWEQVENPQLFLKEVDDSGLSVHRYSAGLGGDHKPAVVTGLLPGEYQVVGTLTAGGRAYRGVVMTEVGNAGGGEVTVPVNPGVDLHGTVRIEGRGAEEYGPFEVWLSPGDGIEFRGDRPRAEPDDQGRFVLPGILPGVWDIGVKPIPPGGYIKAMMLGEEDVLTEEMVIDGATSAPLNIVLSTEGAVVEGTVKTVDGEPAQQGFVLLVPEGRFAHVLSFRKVAAIDEKGEFLIRAVTPGLYRLFALAELAPVALRDARFTEPFAEQGIEVRIGEGEHVERELTLIPPPDQEATP